MKAFSNLSRPLAIAMWDYSWLERRWPGAGYEDWDQALDELQERGYDALRIDAFPHFLAVDPHKTWELAPGGNQQDWGSPGINRVQILPALIEFMQKCADRKIKVGLSSWFREDADDVRRHIADGPAHGELWVKTLDILKTAGLLDSILYVDFWNEWPIDYWSLLRKSASGNIIWRDPACQKWMEQAIGAVRSAYPDFPLTFSLWADAEFKTGDLPYFDFLEPHIWMAWEQEFHERVGYKNTPFDPKGYENLARHGEPLYRSNPAYWQAKMLKSIEWYAALSRKTGFPLVTTEAWAVIYYKDWPLLDWGWVKELCALGTETASTTGRWAAMCTSNFCGPQFRGMWRDVGWHQKLTRKIHEAKLPKDT